MRICIHTEKLKSHLFPFNSAKLSNQFLVAGSESVVDVINTETGKIVHVFETKKDRIQSLNLLVCKDKKLILLAKEDRDGQESFESVISINLV